MTQSPNIDVALWRETSTIRVDPGPAEPGESSGSVILGLSGTGDPFSDVTQRSWMPFGALGSELGPRTKPYVAGPAGVAGSVGDLLSPKRSTREPEVGQILTGALSESELSKGRFEPSLSAALARAGEVSPSATALARARAILVAARYLGTEVDRVSVTNSASVAITLMRGRRYAIFEADEDGDVVLVLTDRTRDTEADTRVVDPGREAAALKTVGRFLKG